jgi:phosphoribosylaminoimidazole-succinocarboxamide synthase
MREIVEPGYIDHVMALCLAIYEHAAAYSRERGLILADTKFEFGLFQESVMLIDEALTPDSSRYYDLEAWRPGGPQPSFDKQYVRDYLNRSGWDHSPPAPPLPASVVQATASRYMELFTRITGEEPE